MRSNFEFLEKTWGPLADLCQAAEQNAAVDPRACIMELGSFAEEVTKRVMETEKLADPGNQMDRIELLREQGILSRQVADILHRLRMNRNEAVHHNQNFSVSFAKIQLNNARMLAQWFVRYYGVDPEAETCEDVRIPDQPQPETRQAEPEIPYIPQPEPAEKESAAAPVPCPDPTHRSGQPDRQISWLRIALAASLLLNVVQAVVWFCS